MDVGRHDVGSFNLDPFGKKSDEDFLGDNFYQLVQIRRRRKSALLADLRGMLQPQELWEALAEFTTGFSNTSLLIPFDQLRQNMSVAQVLEKSQLK